MLTFLTENVSAIFTLAGVTIGALLTFVGTWLLKKRELKLRLWEKVLDKRIEAHEQIFHLSKALRSMVSLGYIEGDGELARTPALLLSKEDFDNWYSYYSQTFGQSSTWLSTDLIRELNLLQDYIVNLHGFLRIAREEKYPEIGALLRYDFIGFSDRIEKLAFQFFSHDLYKLKLNDLREWHKYPIDETNRRLTETALFTRQEELKLLTHAK